MPVPAGVDEGRTAFLRMQSASLVKMLIVTYVDPAPCSTPDGDRVTLMGLLNRLNYAKQNYYLHRSFTTIVDKSLRPEGSGQVNICKVILHTHVLNVCR